MPATRPSAAGRLPVGTVTFLLTDIEGSTRMWETEPAAMEAALDRHNRLLTAEISAHGGVVVTSRGEGDSFFAVFPSAVSAVEAAGACQRRLVAEPWPGRAVRVRMGLHTGEAHVQDGDYVDHAPINRCARVKAAAHGGQVLLTKATSDLVDGRLSAGFALRRLGGFRLRDLIEPELIFQLEHPDLPADFPPIRTASERSSNLPLQVSSFVGRRDEQVRVAALLQRCRVVTLTGPGGVGKTRLAVEVAADQAPHFADGVWLCELAAVRDPALVDEALAAVFSVQAPAGQQIRAALAEYLRAKSVLVVLDNCEHVLAEAAAVTSALVRSCPQLVVLATSREGLAVAGEQVVPIAPLGVPAAGSDLAAITHADAVRLFAERAAAVRPGFAVTAQNADDVARVVRRLDGVALAIELAAARTPAMTPAELARRLERSLAVLARSGRSADERHQTLRATIDWSFALLTAPEQALLRRLAVFAGDATLEAVEAVCSGDGLEPDDVLDLVSSLVSRSLVVAEEHGPQTRYGMLETIRQFADERLHAAGEGEKWRHRHAAFYAELIHQVRHSDPRQQPFWAARLTDAQDNLLQAWSWTTAARATDLALRILTGFAPCEVWSTYPLVLPGEAALDLPGASEHPDYATAVAVSAVLASNRADADRAERLCVQALDAAARGGAPDWRAREAVCAARANVATMRGAFLEAAALHEQAADQARIGADLADVSVELTAAVACYVLADEGPRGVPLSREALAVARRIGAPALIATALLEVGAAVVESDPPQARACLRESREISEALGYSKARDLVWAAGIAFLLRDRRTTLELGVGALRSLQRSGDRLLAGITLQLVAGVLADSQPEAAAVVMGAAESHVISSSRITLLVGAAVASVLGAEHLDGLRARGAAMEWDRAADFALAQASLALATTGSADPDQAD